MGPAGTGAALALALGAVIAGCGFATRSDQFACDGPEDCADGRSCVEGWCVVAGGGSDAAGGGGDPIVCSSGTCEISCDEAGSCPDGVDCTGADSCTVSCGGAGSCGGPILCGTGPCDVTCTGSGSCAGGVDCSAACSCNVLCEGASACGALTCPYGGQCKEGPECRDTPAGTCDRC